MSRSRVFGLLVAAAGVALHLACGSTPPAAPTDCSSLTVAPAAVAIEAGGGTGSVTVTAPAGCGWTAASSVEWLRLVAPAAGTAAGVLAYTAAANNDTTSRSATITIGSQTVRVIQQGATPPSCTFTASPLDAVVPARGAGFLVRVIAPFGCRWSFQGDAGWIAVVPDSDGTSSPGNGNGSVVVQVVENSGAEPRIGTAAIAGARVTVWQDGTARAACSYQVTPATTEFEASGGRGRVEVRSVNEVCGWTALIGGSDFSVVEIEGPKEGTGNGSVDYLVKANTNTSPRQGSLVIQGRTGAGQAILTILQKAARRP